MLLDRICAGAKNVLNKRGFTRFSPVSVKIGTAFYAERGDDTKDDTKGEGVLVYIPNISEGSIDKVKNETVNLLYFLMESRQCTHAILLYQEYAPQAAEIMRTHSVYRVELFQYKYVLFDPTEHEKTPPHQRMTEAEIAQELPKIKLSQLPTILITDAIVRFYDWKPGDVIRILRSGGPYYRLVTQ